MQIFKLKKMKVGIRNKLFVDVLIKVFNNHTLTIP